MLVKFFDRLEHADLLIRTENTGNPENMARRLKMSKRSLHEFLQLLKVAGVTVRYSRKRGTYYYN
ncbi:hypothetical protein [Pedobacter sp. SYP-B3415]|uniref:hypothetical protein n=1 Tax=Pedobacter sp. SYP-B3415 TaxID=2496641 RepID=UPI00101E116D|nr:hypothetical protein [Pedobacter sp. SYP-B3415]